MAKHIILKYVLFGLVLIAGFFSWLSIYQAIKFPEASDWVASMLWFSLFAISLCLMTILVNRIVAVELVAAVSFLFSLIFALSLWHLIISMFCIILMLSGLRSIRKDLDLNIKISLWKSLYTGKFKLVFALAIIICSQYFSIINSTNGQKVIPKFDLSSVTTRLVEPILGMINPNFRTVQQEGLTVDQFILKSQENNAGEKSEQPAQVFQNNAQMVLEEGRKQFSQMTGQELKGDEKIADVFSGLINRKINDYFQPRINSNSQSSLYSYILVAVLFLTVLPLGSLLSLLWFAIIMLIFKIMVRLGLVEITTVTVQREMIL